MNNGGETKGKTRDSRFQKSIRPSQPSLIIPKAADVPSFPGHAWNPLPSAPRLKIISARVVLSSTHGKRKKARWQEKDSKFTDSWTPRIRYWTWCAEFYPRETPWHPQNLRVPGVFVKSKPAEEYCLFAKVLPDGCRIG